MCPAHRLKVIHDIKARLQANQERRERDQSALPLRVISTQLVEAGVNLDFPVVFRALAGFDSVAQAAGRCNREGRLLGRGQVYLFVAPTKPPRGTLQHGLEVARTMLAAEPGSDPLDPAIFDRYFRELYFRRNLDEAGIQALRATWKFKTLAGAFHMIEDDGSEPVIVPYGDAASRLDDLRKKGPSRERLRALQPFIVTVYPQQLEALRAAGALETVADTVQALAVTHQQLYDGRFGLVLEGPFAADPACLLA
jgi:CRISPR-associated endonuclease/helicase Cas3